MPDGAEPKVMVCGSFDGGGSGVDVFVAHPDKMNSKTTTKLDTKGVLNFENDSTVTFPPAKLDAEKVFPGRKNYTQGDASTQQEYTAVP